MRMLHIPAQHDPEPERPADARFLFHIPALPVPVEPLDEIARASGLRGIGTAWFATAAAAGAEPRRQSWARMARKPSR